MQEIDRSARTDFRCALLLLLCAMVTGCSSSTGSTGSTDDIKEIADPQRTADLAAQALRADSVDARKVAVEMLAQRTTIDQSNPIRGTLKEIYAATDEPQVRAACIDGIARGWDYSAMDELLGDLEHESPLVRQHAGAAAERMIGLGFLYRADAPPEQRAVKIARMRDVWQKMQTTGKLDEWLERLANAPDLDHLRKP